MTPPPSAKLVLRDAKEVADVQSRADTRALPINRVGIKDLKHPVRILDRAGEQGTIATFNMYVSLPHSVKGTHMSRFLEILSERPQVSVESLSLLLKRMTDRLEADSAHLTMAFPFFVEKAAPVSKTLSLMDYRVTLSGERTASHAIRRWVKVVVPATSLCPCSKEISAYGAHNQRSHLTISARLREPLWIEELIAIAESAASCELYGVLKRPDEKYVTERAYENPRFVEDMVRELAMQLNREERIGAYQVEAENFESIHNHSAYALIEHDKDA
jgi:GTP cyclohydrolase I